MQTRNPHFPWFFFWKNIRLQGFITAATWLALWWFNQEAALVAFPFILAAFVLKSLVFHHTTKPLKAILARVTHILAEQLPHGERLGLFYRKDEWAQIEAALDEANERLQSQLNLIQAENRKFTTLLASINNEILAVDSQANVLFFNPRFEKNLLYGKEKLQIGGKLWSMLDVSEARDVFTEVLATGQLKKLKGFSLVIQGEPRFYNLTVTPLPGERGQKHGAVGVFTDVTESKLAEQMRVDFVANVSHEIRTPLTSIKGYTQILQNSRQQFSAEFQPFLDKILHNTERMIALFNDLLQLSVIESRDKVKIEVTSLHELVSHAESNVRAIHKDKSFHLKRDIQHEQIPVDPKLFEQVLTNLLENACKYGGPSPEVSLRTYTQDSKLMITIQDNGPGIGREHLARIFERFYRIDNSRDRGTGGTGLGLAIVKHIIMKHHGQIHAESDGERGTTFFLELPLEDVL